MESFTRSSSVIFHTNIEDKKEEEEKVEEQIGYFKLFRYADKLDYFLILLGAVCALIHGVSMPIVFIFFGDLTTDFVGFGKYSSCNYTYTLCLEGGVIGNNTTEADFNDLLLQETNGMTNLNESITTYAIYFSIIAVVVWVSCALQITTFMVQASRQAKKIRILFFERILRQDISFYDMNSVGELNTRLADDVDKINEGMGDKVSMVIMHISRTIACIIVGFCYSWKISLLVLAVAPLLAISSGVLFQLVSMFTKRELDAYAKAGGIAEEVFSSIKTVVTFGGEKKEYNRYCENIKEACRVGILKGFVNGISMGTVYLIMFCMYGLTFWFGSTLVRNQEISVGNMLTAFFTIVIAAFELGQAAAAMEKISTGKAAAFKVFEIIDRKIIIDSLSQTGHKPDKVVGHVRIKNVDFTYPSRTDVQILKDVSFEAESGKTIALCGQSGCGKSTCIQLIQRFYDPQNGVIELDGVDIRTLNVRWLRDHIGVVSQEPILFDTTISQNIRYGRLDVTDQEICEATKQANIYNFIMKLPKKFETLVGEGGAQMSGGQKQRIAIARAIVRDPKVMLLDEATSALDTESEASVQAALDKAAQGRTTIVIAHRLSTIKNADRIIGFHEGKALEQGTHAELLKLDGGVYQNLVKLQTVSVDKDVVSDNKTSTAQVSGGQQMKLKSTTSILSTPNLTDTETIEEDLPKVTFKRIFSYNTPELHYILLGCFCALINGASNPLFAILYAELIRIFSLTDPDYQEQQFRLCSLLFVAVGGVSFLANITQATCFAKSGEELTSRFRKMAFKAILRQEMSYFDDRMNSTGALATRLAVDASKVQGCTGVRLGLIIQSICALGVGMGIAFFYGWELTLMTFAFVPFMVIAGAVQMEVMTGQSNKEQKSFESAGQIATETTMNIRTVASLAREEKFLDNYKEAIKLPYKRSFKKALAHGIAFGFSQCIVFFAYAATFRFGAWLVEEGRITFDNVFKVLMAVIFGAMASGEASSAAPDYAQAKVSAARMFKLFDNTPNIDTYNSSGKKLDVPKGKIGFKDVKFNYPTRPDVQVLKGLNLSIKPGQTIALVGQSGCGKSTCVQFLERFYDPTSGDISFEDENLKEFQISWLRSKMGIVSQEPTLFDCSVADNIRYGDNSREVEMSEVIEAAKNANIHSFIEGLPEGYNTNVGSKGTQLSGGQKQRVAIARALLRSPKVLLLDEATSALDAESEKVVQDALDAAIQGRTTIVIAHRLSTIKNADVIAVIDNGVVVESGSHSELIGLKGAYFALVNAQLHTAA